MGHSASILESYTTVTMARTSECDHLPFWTKLILHENSENDVFDFEIEAAGTEFAAGSDSRTALEFLLDGDQWMIYRNVFTNVLHWDFVGHFRICAVVLLNNV